MSLADKQNTDAIRRLSVQPPAVDSAIAHEAAQGAEVEQSLGLWKSLKLYRKACLWSIFLSTCIVMEGFDITLLNSLYGYPPFQRKFGVLQPDGTYQLTAAWQSGLSNGALCGQIFGLYLNGILADRFGYRKTLVGALFTCAMFIFIIFFSESLVQLLIGEILIGVPWGAFQSLAPSYASEVCPTHLRAYLTSYVNLCWVLGQFLASGVLKAMLLRDDKWGYKIPFALQWMWPIPLAIGIWLAPESPWWLVRRGRLEDAKASLIRLTDRNTEVSFNPDETVSMMIHTNEMEKELVAGTSYRDLFRGANLRRTEIVSVVWCVQALCGSGLIGYSTIFYQQAGMAVENSFTMSLAQYAIMGIGTVLSWVLIGRVGRRSLYLYGQMALFLLLIVMGSVAFAGRENVAAQWTIGSLLLVFTLIYGCTVGPACYCLVAELSSTRLRRKSVAVARNAYNIASCFTNAVTPRMVNPSALNWGGKTALFFAGTCLCCIAWTYFRLPEPKGRTYAELDVLFEQRVSARKFSSTVIDRLDSQVAPVKSSMEKETETVMIERAKTAGAE